METSDLILNINNDIINRIFQHLNLEIELLLLLIMSHVCYF